MQLCGRSGNSIQNNLAKIDKVNIMMFVSIMSTTAPPFPVAADHIAAVRRFNRFHTRLVGALNNQLLKSGLALPQMCVLYEIANAPDDQPTTAADLARDLGMDPGYLSRVISGLIKHGLIVKIARRDSAKRMSLGLTDAGRATFADLKAASIAEVSDLLCRLPPADQAQLVGALTRARRLLGDRSVARTVVLRDPVPGDYGWVIHKHAALYASEYGWDQSFETLVSEIIYKFGRDFVPGRERCWIAEIDGEVVGSVFVVRLDDRCAKLRLLYVDPTARGLGLGRKLVEEAIRFARAAGYKRIVLWTNDILVAARHIYEAVGFTLIEEEAHHSFGKDLVGQNWGLDL